MKKIILALAFFYILVPDTFAQTSDTSLLNLRTYGSHFGFQGGTVHVTSNYIMSASRTDRRTFGELANEPGIDTLLEFALLSYYSPAVIQIRPDAANAMLPADNPRLADQKLGAAVFQEIQILRFLGDTAAVNRHEAVLQFITNRSNVTHAEVEAFYRNGIRGLISEAVDEEFNRISFTLDNTTTRTSYDAVLTRNLKTGEYILDYERLGTKYEPITANSVEALSSAMSRTSNFDQTSRNQVSAQAALIPAVALSDAALNEIKTVLTDFYITPNANTFNAVKDIYVVYAAMRLSSGNELFRISSDSYHDVLSSLNPAIAQRALNESGRQTSITTLTREQQRTLVSLRAAGAAVRWMRMGDRHHKRILNGQNDVKR